MQTVICKNGEIFLFSQPKSSHFALYLTQHEKAIMESNISLLSNKWIPATSAVQYQAGIKNETQGKQEEYCPQKEAAHQLPEHFQIFIW